jgi:predicted PurR-regulated permease PerM
MEYFLMTKKKTDDKNSFMSQPIEAAIRIGLLSLLVFWCFIITQPFMVPIIWGIIIAVATHSIYLWLQTRMGGRAVLAASLFTALLLTLLIVPTVILSTTLFSSASELANKMQAGTVAIPPPPANVAEWPVVGEKLAQVWQLASENLSEALIQLKPQLKSIGQWLLGFLAHAGADVLKFIAAIIIAGFLQVKAKAGHDFSQSLATRLTGNRGAHYVNLSAKIICSVTQGILGIAIIQSILAGLGFVVMGVPAAGLWAFLCLLLGVIQVGAMPIILAVAIYVMSTVDTLPGIIFLIWSIAIGLIDNIFKPILLSRGVDVPMVVVFIGAIGGFISSGIIGLFLGAVILVLSYMLFISWLNDSVELTDVRAEE